MPALKIAYLELPSTNVTRSKNFYGQLFGWSFEDWGPTYAAFAAAEAGLDGGLNGGGPEDHPTRAPLVILQTDDLEAMERKITEAGGTVTVPTFAYPGGRRFHFTDPSGQELAIMQPDAS